MGRLISCLKYIYIQLGPIFPRIINSLFGLSRGGMTPQINDKNTNEMAPNRDLTLKTRASKRPLGEYFGTKDKMAAIVQQNLEKKKEKL